jgi:hypothetical protein
MRKKKNRGESNEEGKWGRRQGKGKVQKMSRRSQEKQEGRKKKSNEVKKR